MFQRVKALQLRIRLEPDTNDGPAAGFTLERVTAFENPAAFPPRVAKVRINIA
jgi:hypothetical protein